MKKRKKIVLSSGYLLVLLVIVCIFLFEFHLNCEAKSANMITIKCYGDSVTEGMKMKDAHKAVIDGSTYPSVLYTILKSKGVNVAVENSGYGGETTSSIVARMGGVQLYLSEDMAFNTEGCAGPIDNKIIASYAPNLQIPVDYPYSYANVSPMIIEGKQYWAKTVVSKDNQRKTYLCKGVDDSTEVLKAGTQVELSGTPNGDVNVIFAGINDNQSITIDTYVAMLKNGIAVSGSKYIIIGPHSRLYSRKGFVSGATPEQRRENYRKRMIAEFGDHFIDLNTDWYERALQVAKENGFLADLSADEIDIIQNKLNSGIIPAEFTYNSSDNSVHLNKYGYTVIAQLVYERLIKLGYI